MAIDGGLSALIRQHITGPGVDLQRIESTTGRGIPDLNYCIDGMEGWAELKATTGWTAGLRPEQVGWIGRRCRAGGRVVVVVRQKSRAMDRDVLWVVRGADVELLHSCGLPKQYPLGPSRSEVEMVLHRSDGGPGKWNWLAVRSCLTS